MPCDVLTNRHMAKLGMAPQPVSWSDHGPLSIHDVSKFFAVPVAEAALKLSVCGSVLQRVCKENGIARWPYRKVTAGKPVEEIIEEGLKELASSNPKAAPSTPENSSSTSGATPAISSPSIDPESAMNAAQADPKQRGTRQAQGEPVAPSPPQKSSQRIQAQVKLSQAGATPSSQRGAAPSQMRSSAVTPAQTKQSTKPAPISDDFRTGFPSKGLRSASTRWWGSLEKDSPAQVEGGGGGSETLSPSPTASSLLVRTRKKASVRGKSAVAHAVTRGYGLHQLGAKDAATLKFVFGDYLPKHWTSSFPPVP